MLALSASDHRALTGGIGQFMPPPGWQPRDRIRYDKAQTMPVALQKTVALGGMLWGSLSAGALIQLLPMVLVVFLLQRHVARGLALGAVN